MKQVEEEYFKLLHDSELQKDGVPSEKLNNVLTPFMHSISETRTVRTRGNIEGGEEGDDKKTSAGFSQDSELMSNSKIGGGKDDTIPKNQETEQMPQKPSNVIITIQENPPPVSAKKAVPKTSAGRPWKFGNTK